MRTSVILQPLRIIDSVAAANIHFKTMTGPSTLLGKRYLQRLYKTLAVDPRHVSLAARVDRHLVGFVTATEDIEKTASMLHSLLTLDSYRALIKKIIAFQVSPIEILKRFKFESYQAKSYRKPYLSIIAFCVDKYYQRKWIGSQLIHRMEKLAKKKGIKSIYVDTRKSNFSARNFYKKLGFFEKAQIFGNVVFCKQS